jgi:cysteine desulfurase
LLVNLCLFTRSSEIFKHMCNVEGPPLKKLRPQLMHSTEPLPIYLDFNATTPVCREAWEAMNECKDHWGNASSIHPYGLDANYVVSAARQRCQRAIGAASPKHIIFTSGGTEANNLAIIGGARTARELSSSQATSSTSRVVRDVILATNTEHPAVEEVLKAMETMFRDVFTTLRVPVDKCTGVLTAAMLKTFLTDDMIRRHNITPDRVALVTVMHANNELGTIHPIAELVRVTKDICGNGALFHTDASQSIGKVKVCVEELGVDFLTVCSHKFYGPKGVGALCIGSNTPLPKNVTFGAGHESGLRPGTENIILYSGMAAALELASFDVPRASKHLFECRQALRETLEGELAKKPGMFITMNGSVDHALPNTLNLAIGYLAQPTPLMPSPVPLFISAQRLILELGHIVAMSVGSACHSSLKEGEAISISAPLRAVGVEEARAVGTLRLTCGRSSTIEEMKRAGRFIARRAMQQLVEGW